MGLRGLSGESLSLEAIHRGGRARRGVHGGSGADVLVAVSGGRDHVDCGAGRDVAYVDRSDVVTRCERIEHRRRRQTAWF